MRRRVGRKEGRKDATRVRARPTAGCENYSRPSPPTPTPTRLSSIGEKEPQNRTAQARIVPGPQVGRPSGRSVGRSSSSSGDPRVSSVQLARLRVGEIAPPRVSFSSSKKTRQRPRLTVVHPENHLGRLARREDHLPLELVRFGHSALVHRPDHALLHICAVRVRSRAKSRRRVSLHHDRIRSVQRTNPFEEGKRKGGGGRNRTETRVLPALVMCRTQLGDQIGRVVPGIVRQDSRNL